MTEIDKNALISDVSFFEGKASFKAQGRAWRYTATRGTLEANTAGEPLHYSREGSFCLSNGQTFGRVLAYADLLGARVLLT